MLKFPHIYLFRNVLAYIEHVNTSPDVPAQYQIHGDVSFEGSVKLHGANCGVVLDIAADLLIPQSRETILTPTADFKGFAKFVIEHEARIRDIFSEILATEGLGDVEKLAIYGEYVGKGVVANNKGSAVSKFDEKMKHWALFDVAIQAPGQEAFSAYQLLDGIERGDRIGTVRDAGVWNLTINFSDPADVASKLAEAEALTTAVGNQCPYGTLYNLEGAGEGIVWRPLGQYKGREDLFWKLKTEAHQGRSKPPRAKRPEVATDVQDAINDFVDATVTENRLSQGLDVMEQQCKPIAKRSTGDFVRWVTADVERECVLDLQDAGLTWEQAASSVSAKARTFFLGIAK